MSSGDIEFAPPASYYRKTSLDTKLVFCKPLSNSRLHDLINKKNIFQHFNPSNLYGNIYLQTTSV